MYFIRVEFLAEYAPDYTGSSSQRFFEVAVHTIEEVGEVLHGEDGDSGIAPYIKDCIVYRADAGKPQFRFTKQLSRPLSKRFHGRSCAYFNSLFEHDCVSVTGAGGSDGCIA
jgi:hypothetical protein